MYTPYKLARELHGHSADVRAVAVLSTGHVATGSRDHSIRVWDPQNQGLSRTLNAHENFVASLTPLSPTPDIPNRLFASGGNDKVICVWDATCTIMSNTTNDNNNNNSNNNDANMTDEVNPASILIGHEGVVCALSSTVDGDIISGSWDKTARVWRNGNCAQELKGHEQSVWAVLGLPTGEIVTASADSTIKLWRGPVGEMKCYKTLKQHTDCVRGLALLPNGVGFVSCSNDETLIVWSLEGEVLQVLRGHTGFVYAVNVVHTGPDAYVIASGSEDRTLRIWRDGDCVQTITHPSGVWSVASGGDGLLVTGCADGVAREWTQDAARVASEDVIEAYEKSVASTSVHKSAVGDLQMDKLPGLDALAKPGNKDGEHLIVKTPAGGAELYSWSAAEGKWAKIGDVVDANEKQSKQVLAGKEYDYVFDIDVNDGTPYKLGYNTGENPYMVAQEFIWREELDQAFLDEVAQFIIKNTGNASMTLGGPSYADPFTGANRYIPGSNPAQTGAAGVDPFTGGNRYVPGSTPQPSTSTGTGNNRYAPYTTPTPSSSSSSTSTSSITSKSHLFPQQLMMSYEGGNIDGLQKKLAEFNAVVPQPLNDAEMKDINALIATLKDQARYHASRVTEDQMRLVVRKLLQWPAANLLPALDLLRLLFTHSHAAETLASLRLTPSLFNIVFTIASDTTSPTNSMLALRVIANMFKASAARKLVETNQAQVLELLPTTAVSDNKNIAHASATILLNLTVFYRTQPFEMGIKQVLSILRAALSRSDVPADVALRLVLAAGTLATIPGVHAEPILTALPTYTSSPDKDLREAATALAQMLA